MIDPATAIPDHPRNFDDLWDLDIDKAVAICDDVYEDETYEIYSILRDLCYAGISPDTVKTSQKILDRLARSFDEKYGK